MSTYGPNAEHNKLLTKPDRVTRESDLEGKTIKNVVWSDEVTYIRFEDDSLAEVSWGNLHSPEGYGLTLLDNYNRISAKIQKELGYLNENEYEKYKKLKKEWEEEEKRKERKRRYESLREEFGPDLSDEDIEELIEMKKKLDVILD